MASGPCREVSTALIRVVAGVIMIHNGLDKLQDPEGFAKFVVEPHLGFLPEPLIWQGGRAHDKG